MITSYEIIFILGLVFQINANQEFRQNNNDTKPRSIPIFPSAYVAEGIISVPNTTIRQPIQVWYDINEGIHRQDYYNGILISLRIRKKNEIRSYDFFPVSTETFKNQFFCNLSVLDGGSKLDSFLPNLSNHRFCGEEIIRGIKTEKWCNETNVKKETVYVKFKNSSMGGHRELAIPVMITKESNCYSQQITITKFFLSKPDAYFITEPLRRGLSCMNGTGFDEYILDESISNGLTYGIHNTTFDLRSEDFADLPDAFDWREHGAVSEVKNQGEDGPCWCFAATGAVESAYLIRSNGTKKFDLSEQALLDCAWGFGTSGYFGGDQVSAFRWIIRHGGIPTEEQYGPYLVKSGYCHADKANLTASISNWGKILPEGNTTILKAAVKRYGPIAAIMDAYTDSFINYSKSDGIYNDPACKTQYDDMNHVVLLIGYGKLNQTEYWIIKNSWGSDWGNHGYAYVAIENNVCGLMNDLTFITI